MADKLNNDSDSFKKIIRDKIQDEPIGASSDEPLWQRVMAEVQSQQPVSKSKPLYWYAAAAIVLLSLSISYVFFMKSSNQDQKEMSLADRTVSKKEPLVNPIAHSQNQDTLTNTKAREKNTSQKEKSTSKSNMTQQVVALDNIVNHNLPDGSKVSINSNSSIVNLSYATTREISMKGEVYFEVVSNKTKPFLVYFGNHKLEVVGTKFNVRSFDNEDVREVTVTEGTVKVFENNHTTKLVRAGEQLKLYPQKESVLSHVEAINFISWKTSVLDFKNSRLEDVAQILTRLFHQQVSVDAHVKDCIFSGDLTHMKLDEALEIIKISSGLTIEKKAHKILLSGHGCD